MEKDYTECQKYKQNSAMTEGFLKWFATKQTLGNFKRDSVKISLSHGKKTPWSPFLSHDSVNHCQMPLWKRGKLFCCNLQDPLEAFFRRFCVDPKSFFENGRKKMKWHKKMIMCSGDILGDSKCRERTSYARLFQGWESWFNFLPLFDFLRLGVEKEEMNFCNAT